MRPKDSTIESSRDILRKIEENISANIKILKTNKKSYDKIFQKEKNCLDLFLENNKDINHLTNFKIIQKIQNLNIKW